MSRIKKNMVVISFLVLALSFTSCYGPFKLTNKLYDWNGKVGDKVVNSLVFVGFVVIPVYEVSLFLDGIVFNTIEFWTGNNPIAMNDGESESKVVKTESGEYIITARKNSYIIEKKDGAEGYEKAELKYNPEDLSWYLITENGKHKVVSISEETGEAEAYLPDGSVIKAEEIARR